MPSVAAQARCSPEEYLALERKAEYKSEYLNGQTMAMSGASRRHNLIAGNLYRELSRQLRGRQCEAYMSDLRVKVRSTGLYTYPDIAVACGDILFEDAEIDTLINPNVIVEVLSPSTEAYDRGEKFAHYRRLESLQEYVLVSQDRVRIEYYVRQGTQWVFSEASTRDETIRIESIGCDVSLQDVYEKIEFPETGNSVSSGQRI